jgi:hypothetical protein
MIDNNIFNYYNKKWIDIESKDICQCESYIKWIYRVNNLSQPEIIIIENIDNLLKNLKSFKYRNITQWNFIGDIIYDKIENLLHNSKELNKTFYDWTYLLPDDIRTEKHNGIESILKKFHYIIKTEELSCLLYSTGFCIWYEYWVHVKKIKSIHEIDKYIIYLSSGVFYNLFFENIVFIIKK